MLTGLVDGLQEVWARCTYPRAGLHACLWNCFCQVCIVCTAALMGVRCTGVHTCCGYLVHRRGPLHAAIWLQSLRCGSSLCLLLLAHCARSHACRLGQVVIGSFTLCTLAWIRLWLSSDAMHKGNNSMHANHIAGCSANASGNMKAHT